MPKKKSKLQIAQEMTEKQLKEVNKKIEELGKNTDSLYLCLKELEDIIDTIRNIPREQYIKYNKLKTLRLNWKQHADRIEADSKKAMVQNAGSGVAGVGVGVAAAAMGPNIAMGIATTYGVASTGTPIALLYGAAAKNAALAWLGGGVLAEGGGGMIAGETLLEFLGGPTGWIIAGVSLVGSGLLFIKNKNDRQRLESIYALISERDYKKFNLAYVELNTRIKKIKEETVLLGEVINKIGTLGKNYDAMTVEQQLELGAYYNLMNSSTQLLVGPIEALRPKYTEKDLELFMREHPVYQVLLARKNMKTFFIYLAELLYKIELDSIDKKLLWKSLRNNKPFLKAIGIDKKDFEEFFLTDIEIALKAVY